MNACFNAVRERTFWDRCGGIYHVYSTWAMGHPYLRASGYAATYSRDGRVLWVWTGPTFAAGLQACELRGTDRDTGSRVLPLQWTRTGRLWVAKPDGRPDLEVRIAAVSVEDRIMARGTEPRGRRVYRPWIENLLPEEGVARAWTPIYDEASLTLAINAVERLAASMLVPSSLLRLCEFLRADRSKGEPS